MRMVWIGWIVIGLWMAPPSAWAATVEGRTPSLNSPPQDSWAGKNPASKPAPFPEGPVAPIIGLPMPAPSIFVQPEVPERTGIPRLDSAMHYGKPLSLLPYWYHYPWKRVHDPAGWTIFLAKMIQVQGPDLLTTIPRDIMWYCPRYSTLHAEDRVIFWMRLISILAEQESTYDTKSTTQDVQVGPDVLSSGLLMLSLRSAQYPVYGCSMIKAQRDLVDWKKNMSCAVRIMNVMVKRDGVISWNDGQTEPGEWKGLARYWGPFRDSRLKTRAGRQSVNLLVTQKRAFWRKQVALKRHPAFDDQYFRAERESKTLKLMRLLNAMPICQ